MFSIQSYYRNDIQILRDLGYAVMLSNSVVDFLAFWKYDIGFFYFYRYSAFGAFFSKLLGKKNVFTGGIDYLEPSFATTKQRIIQELFFKICNIFSDVNILVSTTDCENIKRIYNGKLPQKCRLCFHVIDFERFVYRGEKKNKIITTIAWMVNRDNVYRKGVDKTIKAFSLFVKEHPDYRLIIAGPPGEGSDEILKLISQLGIENSVEYRGAISEDEKVHLLKSSMIYSQLSIYEGFGIAAIEALASGNILVHSGRGGLKDAISQNGFIVAVDNLEEIVQTFKQVASMSVEEMDELRVQGIEYVRKYFSYESRLLNFQKIFNNMI